MYDHMRLTNVLSCFLSNSSGTRRFIQSKPRIISCSRNDLPAQSMNPPVCLPFRPSNNQILPPRAKQTHRVEAFDLDRLVRRHQHRGTRHCQSQRDTIAKHSVRRACPRGIDMAFDVSQGELQLIGKRLVFFHVFNSCVYGFKATACIAHNTSYAWSRDNKNAGRSAILIFLSISINKKSIMAVSIDFSTPVSKSEYVRIIFHKTQILTTQFVIQGDFIYESNRYC